MACPCLHHRPGYAFPMLHRTFGGLRAGQASPSDDLAGMLALRAAPSGACESEVLGSVCLLSCKYDPGRILPNRADSLKGRRLIGEDQPASPSDSH